MSFSDTDLCAAIPLLRKRCRSLTPDAEDLVQDTIEMALRKRHTYKPNGTDLSRWLFIVARNLHVTAVRKAIRTPESVGLEGEASSVSSIEGQTPLALIIRDLQKAIDDLRPQDRDVILDYCTSDGERGDCILGAERLNMLDSTYRSRLSKARIALREVV